VSHAHHKTVHLAKMLGEDDWGYNTERQTTEEETDPCMTHGAGREAGSILSAEGRSSLKVRRKPRSVELALNLFRYWGLSPVRTNIRTHYYDQQPCTPRNT